MNTKLVSVTTRSQIEKLGSAITVEGLCPGPDGIGAFADWCHGVARAKKDPLLCHVIKGSVMNRAYGLTGSNRYDPDLNIVSFALEDFENPSAMVMPRFEIGARWLSDVVENNKAREKTEW